MSEDKSSSMHMEDDEARRLAQQPDNEGEQEENKQGADKRAPDRDQGQSVPAGANDAGAGEGTGSGAEGGGGSPAQEGADTGGASYGGGTGNP